MKIWGGSGEGFVSGEIDDDLLQCMMRELISLGTMNKPNVVESVSFRTFLSNDINGSFAKIQELLRGYDNMYIFGASGEGIFLARCLSDLGYRCKMIDNNEQKQGHMVEGMDVVAFDNAIPEGSLIIVSVKSDIHKKEVIQQITNSGRKYRIIENGMLYSLFDGLKN